MTVDRSLPDLGSFDDESWRDVGSTPVPPGTADADRFHRALGLIDAANADDPNTIRIGDHDLPKELAHAVLASAWVRSFDPDADEAQLLAARAHHLRRWSVARDDYPEGRAGYLRWRATLKKQHARDVADVLTEAGYDDAVIQRVQHLVRKEGLARDAAVQTHEDALCLVFLQTQLPALSDQLGHDRIVEVVAKTMQKMSPAAIDAVGRLGLDERCVAIIGEAAVAAEGTSTPD